MPPLLTMCNVFLDISVAFSAVFVHMHCYCIRPSCNQNMYNAGVSPEALQQGRNEGQREAVRENGTTLFAMPIKHKKKAETKKLWREKRDRESEKSKQLKKNLRYK